MNKHGLMCALLVGIACCDTESIPGSPTVPGTPTSRVVGAACETVCEAGPDGRATSCVGGRCELEGCEPASLGCGCAPGDTCDTLYPVDVACSERGMCEPSGCTPGERWCGCGSGCAEGDTCVAGICRPPETTLTVAATARACSFRVDAPGADVVFAEGIAGRVYRRGGTLGIAIASRDGESVDGPALRIRPRGASVPVSVRSAQCIDRSGRSVSDSGVRVE